MSTRPPRLPNRLCLGGCGKRTQAISQWCIPRRPVRDVVEAGLPEGRWVPNGRGIVVYRVAATGLEVGAA